MVRSDFSVQVLSLSWIVLQTFTWASRFCCVRRMFTRRVIIPSTDLIGKPENAVLVEHEIISSLRENIV